MKKTILFFFSLICMQSLFAYEMRDEVKLEPLCGEEITFEAQAETGYHFLYWSDGVTDPIRTFTPEQSADYIAYFEIDTCIVIFYNSDNTILKKDTLKFGENIYDNRPADPTIPESQKEPGHEYAFNGWNPTLSPDYTVPEKTDTLKYYATYSDIMLSYTIHFINWDNTPIKDITLQYGSQIDTCKQVPGYDGQNKPTKPENDTCSFTFKGWDPDITGAIVTGEATYMALYDTIYNLFTVTVAIDPAFGEVSKTPGQYEGDTYHFGDSVEITVTNIDVCYQFKQWIYTGTETQFTNEMTYKFAVTKNMDLTAILERIKFEINIKSNNGTQGKVGGQVIIPKGVCFEAKEAGATIRMSSAPNLTYSIDNGTTYEDWDGSQITLTNAGDKVYIKANETGNNTIENTFATSKQLSVSGNIMYLLNGETPATTMTADNAKCFQYLFMSSTIVDASKLQMPATTLAENCYNGMFFLCSDMKQAPILPAKTMAPSCYMAMFYNCSSLTAAPQLPATTLASNCYNGMFCGCTSLTTAPALPAQTLQDGCYGGMFQGCTGLATAPELPATTVVKNCYHSMFRGCTSLTMAPELKANTLEDDCYGSMFFGCSNLTTAPVLKAKELKNGCYLGMFYDCDNLTELTILSTSIAAGVYSHQALGIQWLPYSSDQSKILRVDSTMVNWWKNSFNCGWTVVAYEE